MRTVLMRVFRLFVLVSFLGLVSSAGAQNQSSEYQPRVGQAGKDVIWVPTPQELVDKMLNMAKAAPGDFVMDLGSGDGRTVITAAKRGIRAHGIEYNPEMVELSKRDAAKEGVSDRATFEKADLFETDLSKATVITMFLLPEINLKLRPKILDLKPGTRVVSNSFTMGEWATDEHAILSDDCMTWCTALLWIVPAKVGGAWQLSQGELNLKQSYQMLSGEIKAGSQTSAISNGRMNGEQISFSVGSTSYTGRVNGNMMEGKTSSGQTWKAVRK